MLLLWPGWSATRLIRICMTIHLWMIWIILFGVPGVLLGAVSSALLSAVAWSSNRKKKYCRAIHNILLSTAEQLFWFLKKEEKDGEKCLIISGLTAPAGYTYFLLYAFLLLTVHCLFAFFDASVNIYYTVDYPGVKVVPCNEFYNYTVNTTSNTCLLRQFQIELSLLKGFEASTVTLTVAVLTFAFITLFLLKCSGGRKDFKKSCFGRTICGYKVRILLIIQAVFVCTPRAGLVALYLLHDTLSEQSVDKPFEWRWKTRILSFEQSTGILDKESFFTLAAVCDSISTAMLTPWYRFEKKETEGWWLSNETTHHSSSCPYKNLMFHCFKYCFPYMNIRYFCLLYNVYYSSTCMCTL